MFERPEARYKVGDHVIITGSDRCAFGTNQHMEDQVGTEVRITKVQWDSTRKVYYYNTTGPEGHWKWCDNCFESSIADLPEFEAESEDAVFSLFS